MRQRHGRQPGAEVGGQLVVVERHHGDVAGDREPRLRDRLVGRLTPSGFGHDGAGGQVACADPDAGVGFAFLTNRMEGVGDVRATRVVEALATALRLPAPRGL
ncbi:serine hydrolase [Rathayibacter sp. AY1D2]|uniref:serine hydrolase n=1 Tax=Rathayibacter sp. AY1D2 TaxID=2080543 RepID=UPI0035BE355F